MFQQVGSLFGVPDVAPPKDLGSFPMTASEAAVEGAVYVFTAGRLTLGAGAITDAAVIALESADGKADVGGEPQVFVRAQIILPGSIYKVPITAKNGTPLPGAMHASIVVGAKVKINDTGLGVDGASNAATYQGPLTILRIDRTANVAWVVFNTCAVCIDRDTLPSG